jgi:hypothetical protein
MGYNDNFEDQDNGSTDNSETYDCSEEMGEEQREEQERRETEEDFYPGHPSSMYFGEDS